MDALISTHAAFYGTSGFVVFDLTENTHVMQMRIRGDGDSADAKDVLLYAGDTISGPWSTLIPRMVATTDLSWQESAPFGRTARYRVVEIHQGAYTIIAQLYWG
eukprot:gene57061-biopygen84325